MRYVKNGAEIHLGDNVLVEGSIQGIVVCDFDNWKCLDGYDKWLTKEELIGGGTLSRGIMVKTDELGFLYYSEEDENILFEAR